MVTAQQLQALGQTAQLAQERIQSQQQQVEEAQARITSQQQLRQAGLQGRVQRGLALSQIERIRGALGSQAQRVGLIQEQIGGVSGAIDEARLRQEGILGVVDKGGLGIADLPSEDQKIAEQLLARDAALSAQARSALNVNEFLAREGVQSLPDGTVLLKSGEIFDPESFIISTPAERALQQSLPDELAFLPPEQALIATQEIQRTAAIPEPQTFFGRVSASTQSFLTPEGVRDVIGGASERFVGGIQTRIVDPLLSRIPQRTGEVEVPRRTFAPSGTGAFDPSTGFFVPTPQTETTIQPQFSLLGGLGGLQSPISAADVGLTLFFAPAFSTGVASRQSRFVEVRGASGELLGFTEISALREGFSQLSRVEGIVKIQLQNQIRARLQDLLRRATTEREISGLRTLARRFGGSEGEQIFQSVLRETQLIGQPINLPDLRPRSGGAPAQSPPAVTLSGGGAEARMLSETSAFQGTGQFERTQFEVPRIPQGSSNVLSLRTSTLTGQTPSQRLSQQLSQFQPQISRQVSALGQPQLQRVGQDLSQQQRQRLRQLTLLRSVQRQQSRQQQRQGGMLRMRTRAREQTRPPRPRLRPPTPIPPLPSGTVRQRLNRALSSFTGGVNVVVGMGSKKKVIARDLPKNRGLKTGLDFIQKNIQASFKLESTGRSARGSDIARPLVSNMFRLGKNDPLRIVEKKQFRLDSGSEISQIMSAKKRSPKKKTRRRR